MDSKKLFIPGHAPGCNDCPLQDPNIYYEDGRLHRPHCRLEVEDNEPLIRAYFHFLRAGNDVRYQPEDKMRYEQEIEKIAKRMAVKIVDTFPEFALSIELKRNKEGNMSGATYDNSYEDPERCPVISFHALDDLEIEKELFFVILIEIRREIISRTSDLTRMIFPTENSNKTAFSREEINEKYMQILRSNFNFLARIIDNPESVDDEDRSMITILLSQVYRAIMTKKQKLQLKDYKVIGLQIDLYVLEMLQGTKEWKPIDQIVEMYYPNIIFKEEE